MRNAHHLPLVECFRCGALIAVFFTVQATAVTSSRADEVAAGYDLSPPPAGRWVLPGLCLLQCASYDTGQAGLVRQGYVFEQELLPGGILSTEGDHLVFLWRVGIWTSEHEITGPCAVRLYADGRYEPLCAGDADKTGHGPGSGIASGSRSAVARDTRYHAVFTAEGAVCLELLEGEIAVRDSLLGDERVLRSGQGVYFGVRWQGPGGDIAEPAFRILESRLLSEQCGELRRLNRSTRSKSGGTAQEALAAYTRRLPGRASADAVRAALAIEAAHPGSPEASRSLYLGWLVATSLGDDRSAALAAATLVQAHPKSYWTSLTRDLESDPQPVLDPIP